MIHPGECEEWPCIAGIYELQLGNSHHIWVFIYAYSYINVKLGHSADEYVSKTFERNVNKNKIEIECAFRDNKLPF